LSDPTLLTFEMADSSAAEPTTGASSPPVASDENSTQIQPIRMPTIEEIRAQEVWNNCAVRAVTSGVMGQFKYPLFLDLYCSIALIFQKCEKL